MPTPSLIELHRPSPPPPAASVSSDNDEKETCLLSTFHSIARTEFAAYHPDSKVLNLFFPTVVFSNPSPSSTPSSQPTALDQAIKSARDRQCASHKKDASSRWIIVVEGSDNDAEKAASKGELMVLGAANWYFPPSSANHHNEQEEKVEEAQQQDDDNGKIQPQKKGKGEGEGKEEGCYWYPPGGQRDLANELMAQFGRHHKQFMTKPHAFLLNCFVHPTARRRGIGQMLVNWGLNIADDLSLESYLSATAAGNPLYKSCGFVEGAPIDWQRPEDILERSEEARAIEGTLLPFRWWPMWRAAKSGNGGNDGSDVGKGEAARVPPWDR